MSWQKETDRHCKDGGGTAALGMVNESGRRLCSAEEECAAYVLADLRPIEYDSNRLERTHDDDELAVGSAVGVCDVERLLGHL